MSFSDNLLYIYRGFDKTILFLPGWAFDYRIFKNLDLSFNYIFPHNSYLKNEFFKDFFLFIKKNKICTFLVVGWSMGGFFVADLLKKLENSVYIPAVYLLNIRSYFNETEVDEKISLIKTDKINTLKEFYKLVFLGHRNEYYFFKNELENDYLKCFNSEELIKGLNYLRKRNIDLSFSVDIKTIIVQGSLDKLVMPEMYPEISEGMNVSCHILKTGHLSFLSKDFKEILLNCNVKKI